MIAASNSLSEIVPIIGYIGIVVSGVFLVLGSRARTTSDQQDKSITALSGRLAAAQDEIRELKQADEHKESILAEKQHQLDRQQAQIEALKDSVSSRDLLIVGFSELGVDKSKLAAAASHRTERRL